VAADPRADAAQPAGADPQERVQRAVEAFVAARARGEQPEPAAFAAAYEEDLRGEILSQCQQFLAFDGMLGAQEWSDHEAEAVDVDEQGRRFGDFDILEELGRGGNGVVYLARQRSLDRRVALKVMASGLSLSKRHVERFHREATATAQLRHQAIVPVHSFFEVDGTFGLAMEYVAGRTLAEVLSDLSLRNQGAGGVGGVEGVLGIAPDKGYIAECALLAAEVASALAVAHEAKIVHRDLKPHNLMLDDRHQVRLLDFGLAKSLEPSDAALSRSGELNGTLHYVSPEQTLANRVTIDERTDVWSLGVILYELLTLTRPFEGKDRAQVFAAISLKEPAPPQRRNPKVPRDLATICAKALEKDPNRRYQSAAAFEADLRRFLNWEPIHARPVGAFGRASKWVRRHRVAAALAAALLLTTAVTLGLYSYRRAADDREATRLMADAAASADAGDFVRAIARTSEALTYRNDEVTRERLERYYAESKRVENEVGLQILRSARMLGSDPAAARELALTAANRLSTLETRSAVLATLGRSAKTKSLPVQGAGALSYATSPSGDYVAIGGRRGGLQVSRTDGGGEPQLLRGHDPGELVASVAFVDEDRLVSIGYGRTLMLWDRRAVTPTKTVPLGGFGALRMMLDRGRGRALLVMQQLTPPRRVGVRAFDARTGAPVGPFVEHAQQVPATAFRPDGEVAACYGNNKRLRLWRVTDGEDLLELEPDMTPFSMAFSEDGDLLALGGKHGEVAVYDARTGDLVGAGRHTDRVSAVAFSPSGDQLLTGSWDQSARLWGLDRSRLAQPLRELRLFSCHDEEVQTVAFSASGELAAIASRGPNGVIRVFPCSGSGSSHALSDYRASEAFLDVGFLPGGREPVALTPRRAVVWSYRTDVGAISAQQPGRVDSVAFLEGDDGLLTSGDDERLRRWDRRTGELAWRTEKLGDPVDRVAVDANNARCAAALDGGEVTVRAVDDGRALAGFESGLDRVVALSFLSGGEVLTVGELGAPARGVASVTDPASGRVGRQQQLAGPVVAASVHPGSARLVTVSGEPRQVQLWSLPELELLETLPVAGLQPRDVAFAPDGASLLVAGRPPRDGSRAGVRIYHLERDAVRELAPGVDVEHAAFAPDGGSVLTCSARQAQLWSADEDGGQLLRVDLHGGRILRSCAFSHDAAWVATGAKDGSIWIWPTDPVRIAEQLR